MDPVSTQIDPPKKSTKFGQSIVPTHTLKDAPALDVLLVPGGLGTRNPDPALVDYISNTYPSLKYIISVCTGAGLLARAGVLKDKTATTNKKAFIETSQLGSDTTWLTHARWVEYGNVWTSSGVSAGIDVMYAWIEKVFGDDKAQEIANGSEYRRVKDWRDDPFADLYCLPPP
ncbi:MAG: hypothetical protein Q9190_000512 [Brigantiaea leucoxantha]